MSFLIKETNAALIAFIAYQNYQWFLIKEPSAALLNFISYNKYHTLFAIEETNAASIAVALLGKLFFKDQDITNSQRAPV